MTTVSSRRASAALALLLAAALAGCSIIESSIGSALGSAGSAAGNQVGTSVGNQVGSSVSSRWVGPNVNAALMQQMSQFYTQYIFSLAFGSGGYAVATEDYKPGNFTRWNLSSSGEKGKGATLERARLFDDAEGNQWWKVKWVDGEKGDTIILEALLSPKDAKMLRLRGKFPNDQAGKEMAVSDNAWYVPPQKLSQKSIEGATTGTENVTVPAGGFSAKKVVFGDVASTHTWWLANGVPGQTVKQETRGQKHGGGDGPDSSNYTMELAAYGANAVTELGTK